MEGDRPDHVDPARKEATDSNKLPEVVQHVVPNVPLVDLASVSAPSGFASVQLRPDGQRYGDADLVPGGSLEGGGMLMNGRNFPSRGTGGIQGDPSGVHSHGRGGLANRPEFGSAEGYARFDPMFPGQMPQRGSNGGRGGRPFGGAWRGGLGAAPRMPGEPDDDNFFPPSGRPGEPFGGPGGGQFGPGQGSFGGWCGQGGGNSRWR